MATHIATVVGLASLPPNVVVSVTLAPSTSLPSVVAVTQMLYAVFGDSPSSV